MNQIIALIVVVLIVISLISYVVGVYNKLVMLKNNVAKSFANIDVILKQRVDEIPNLVTVVKEASKYEAETLEKLTQLRTKFMNSDNIDEKVETSNEIGKVLKTVFAVSENYPELKANDSYRDLQRRVSQLEDNIADRREFFNESVNMYNIGIAEFPNLIFAKICGYKGKSMLYVSDDEKKYDGVRF